MAESERRLVGGEMAVLLSAQFFSALADNALLVAAIALAKQTGEPWLAPVLQEFFILPFILLAPLVGVFADALPKGRVMLLANFLKLAGAALMASKFDPLVSYAIVGVGAAAYSPAKYGILSQLFQSGQLVRANGMLEGSTLVAILTGVYLSGAAADISVDFALALVEALYAVSALANLFVPKLAAERRPDSLSPRVLVSDYLRSLKTLFSDIDSRFSLLGTSLFWGSGATLRLVLFAWVPVALNINDNRTPAMLLAVLSIGIIAGAYAVGSLISLEKINRALYPGLAIGPLLMLLSLSRDLDSALLLSVLLGFCGGTFAIPLNALLQHRGLLSVGSGRALAVQNFSENLSMLLLIGVYSVAAASGVPALISAFGFGLLVLGCMVLLAIARLRKRAT